MEKTLKELELNLPTISLLESRKITGGYDGMEGEQYLDDGWWQGSPGEENNPYEIPEVVVEAPELPDSGYDPREADPQEQEDPDMYQGEDGRDNEMNPQEQNNNDGKNELTVQVPDGWCVLGAIAAAIQVATGCSSDDAIKAADTAFDKCGLNPDPSPGDLGISTPSGSQLGELLEAAGFNVTFGTEDGAITPQNVSDHFDAGGAGLGYIDGDNSGHMVYLEDYHLDTNIYDYYDPVLGIENSISGNDCQIILFN